MTTMQQLSAAQASPEVVINENFESLEHQAVYGNDPTTTTGLTRGYLGGRWGGFSVAAGTLSLDASQTVYMVVAVADGVPSKSTSNTNWNNTTDYKRVYKFTTSGSAVTAVEDHRAGPGGVHGGAAGSSAVDADDVTYTPTTLADWDGSADPGDVEQALDQLAERVADVEAGGGGAGGTKTYGIFTPMTSLPPAANFATLDTRNSLAVLDFDDSTQESCAWVGVIPEGAVFASGLKVRIFWMATSATSGNVRWGALFEKYGTDIDSASFDTDAEAHTACSGTSGIEVVTEITITTVDGLAAGDRYQLAIYRDCLDTTNDTMTGDAELVAVELRAV
jgi:hypothetical protein